MKIGTCCRPYDSSSRKRESGLFACSIISGEKRERRLKTWKNSPKFSKLGIYVLRNTWINLWLNETFQMIQKRFKMENSMKLISDFYFWQHYRPSRILTRNTEDDLAFNQLFNKVTSLSTCSCSHSNDQSSISYTAYTAGHWNMHNPPNNRFQLIVCKSLCFFEIWSWRNGSLSWWQR